MGTLLFDAFVYLLAAVIAVPIAKRLGLGSVLGYLIAGVIIGPLMGIVGNETADVQHFAEFGVVMMLFIVGLELEPRALWSMRGQLFGLGGMQVVLTVAAITVGGIVLGLSWPTALAVSFVFALSSTAIVLQTLGEKGLLKSPGGEASFSVLLAQDIAVIPMLAIIPLLALPEFSQSGIGASELLHAAGSDASSSHAADTGYIAGMAGWQRALITLGAVAAVIVGGHFLSTPLFRFIAASGLREMFTATALVLVIGIALLMTAVGLSPALGTFLAGVVLATSEYRHELESDIEPFKGLLLGLFFITVGAGVNFAVLADQWLLVIGLTFAVMGIKALVLLLLAVVFKLKGADRWLLFLALAQVGEFGFVLISFCLQSYAMDEPLSRTLLLVVALSMLLTPLLFIFFEKFVQPRYIQAQCREDDEISEQGVAIIAGHGRFGQVINRLLLSNGFETIVLDRHAELVDNMRAFNVKTFYGDASRPDLLHAAGLQKAKLLVVAIDDKEQALKLIAHARRERPDIHIVARAYDRRHVYQLYQSGTNDIVRETFDSALRSGRYSLQALGFTEQQALDAVAMYADKDVEGIRKLAAVFDPDIPVSKNPEYIRLAIEIQAELEQAMRGQK
ncbi:MAG: cation:proton antiporter [Granulosicoccus sp.]